MHYQTERQSYFIKISLLAHFFLICSIWGISTLLSRDSRKDEVVEFRVIEKPVTAKKESIMPLRAAPIVKKIEKKKLKKKKAREVFGASRRSLKSKSKNALQVKKGNTISKEIDDKILKKSDEDSLPVPEEEFLVTSMPRIKKEFRAAYPQVAKEKGLEGKVVLEILIDEYGKVRTAKVLSSPDKDLSESALKSIFRFEFYPAEIGERNVAVVIRYGINFILEN